MSTDASIDALWASYQTDGYAALSHAQPAGADASFYLALLAYGHQDITRAAQLALDASTQQPANPVYKEAAIHLQRVVREGKQAVYVTGEAFSAFIRGGGNLPLYEHTSGALKSVYAEYSGVSLLDIGVGDGLALLAAVTEQVKSVTLVEPSAAMLAVASKALAELTNERGMEVDAVNCSFQDFARSETGAWDVAQATYSLQSIDPKNRPPLMRWLRENTKRVLLVEFDPPAFGDAMYSPERARHVLERYALGLTEYDDGGLVAQGFLMPVMFGYFDQTVARANYEQPIDAWMEELRQAGFTQVDKRPLFNYWWAPAYLVDARV